MNESILLLISWGWGWEGVDFLFPWLYSCETVLLLLLNQCPVSSAWTVRNVTHLSSPLISVLQRIICIIRCISSQSRWSHVCLPLRWESNHHTEHPAGLKHCWVCKQRFIIRWIEAVALIRRFKSLKHLICIWFVLFLKDMKNSTSENWAFENVKYKLHSIHFSLFT